jgi:hypothetical protein
MVPTKDFCVTRHSAARPEQSVRLDGTFGKLTTYPCREIIEAAGRVTALLSEVLSAPTLPQTDNPPKTRQDLGIQWKFFCNFVELGKSCSHRTWRRIPCSI